MPITKDQQIEVLANLKSSMSAQFRTTLSEHDLMMAREHASKIAGHHHSDHDYKTIVVHVDLVPFRNDSHLAVLEYGSASRHTMTIKDDDDNVIKALGEQSPEMGEAVVCALKGLRVPARLKTTRLVGCPVCDHYHPADFDGDCRDDGNRFPTPNDGNDIAYHFDNGDPGTDWLEDEDNQKDD